MALLVTGVILWIAAHLFKRLYPQARAALGDRGKALVAVALLVSIVMMVTGYRSAGVITLWTPPDFMIHINNLLMLVAVFLLGMGSAPGPLRTKMRHPMLTAVKVWAVAHLLVNGDLASVILFGGMLGWAVAEVVLINRQEPEWTPPVPGPAIRDLVYGMAALALFGVIVMVHMWIGPSPV